MLFFFKLEMASVHFLFPGFSFPTIKVPVANCRIAVSFVVLKLHKNPMCYDISGVILVLLQEAKSNLTMEKLS